MVDFQEKSRRGATRFPVGFRVNMQASGQLKEAIAANISMGGLFIETEEKIPLNTIIDLTFSLPLLKQEITIKSAVVHLQQKDTASGRPQGLGLQFVEITEEQKTTLLKFVDELENSGKQEISSGKIEPFSFSPIFANKNLKIIEDFVSAEKKKNKTADYYQLLAVKKSAGKEDIRRAYHQFCALYHPDLYLGSLNKELLRELEKIYNQKTIAYRTLKNNKTRLNYDLDHGIMDQSKEISNLEKKQLLQARDYAKKNRKEAEQAARLYQMAQRELQNGADKAAINNLKLAVQLNPFDQQIKNCLAKLTAKEENS